MYQYRGRALWWFSCSGRLDNKRMLLSMRKPCDLKKLGLRRRRVWQRRHGEQRNERSPRKPSA